MDAIYAKKSRSTQNGHEPPIIYHTIWAWVYKNKIKNYNSFWLDSRQGLKLKKQKIENGHTPMDGSQFGYLSKGEK